MEEFAWTPKEKQELRKELRIAKMRRNAMERKFRKILADIDLKIKELEEDLK